MSLDQPGLVAGRESSLMRSVNVGMRQLAETHPDDAELIPFFCECQTPSCYSGVWMTANTFDAAVADADGWLLLDGHKPSARWSQEDPLSSQQTQQLLETGAAGGIDASPLVAKHWRSAARRRLARRPQHLDQTGRL